MMLIVILHVNNMEEYLKHLLKVKYREINFNFKTQNEHMLYYVNI